ncbi:MAG TPA: carbohydrate-binding family 9-like protein, partial [Myxococcaceae bacterium]|nr:carbohydrate-binding family 9-like protein [Myxococcaceae bacterium]
MSTGFWTKQRGRQSLNVESSKGSVDRLLVFRLAGTGARAIRRTMRQSLKRTVSLLVAASLSTGVAACRDEMAGPPSSRHTAAPERVSPPPEYAVAFTPSPPVIDGDLTDKAWGLAQAVVLRNSLSGAPVRETTQLRLLHDGRFLYAAFDCQDADVWGTLLQRDEPLYTQEVVELFVDADGDGKTYQEIEVSPRNTVFDASFPARRQGMDLSYDSGVSSAVQVKGTLNLPEDLDRGWSVELRIPLRSFSPAPPPVAGKEQRWRFNAYRLEHAKRTQVEGQA